MSLSIRSIIAAAALFAASSSHAAITVLASYRLGDADASPVPGTAVASTQPSVGATPLAAFGAPTYAIQVAPGGQPSIRSIGFNGAADRLEGPVLTSVTDNFGIEAWVRSNGRTTDNAVIAYNGNTGNSGFGLFRIGGSFGFLYGGNVAAPVVPVSTQWTHLAVVRDGGVTRFFVNGAQAASSMAGPNPAAGNFMVGGNPLQAVEGFDGLIDEVRLFTFQPGQFVVADLNYLAPPRSVPGVNGLGVLALVLALALAGLWRLGRTG